MSDLLAFDREHVWHPYTSMTDPTPVRMVTGASGVRLTLEDGHEVVDGMSSWWAAIHGYRHPCLDAALKAQADDFAHVMFGGLTHAPAVQLAQRLVEMTPAGLRVSSESGSVVVDGLFAHPAYEQAAPFAAQLGLEMRESGCIAVNLFGQTSVHGVYAAGDLAHVADLPMPMASVLAAAYAGQMAGASALRDMVTPASS